MTVTFASTLTLLFGYLTLFIASVYLFPALVSSCFSFFFFLSVASLKWPEVTLLQFYCLFSLRSPCHVKTLITTIFCVPFLGVLLFLTNISVSLKLAVCDWVLCECEPYGRPLNFLLAATDENLRFIFISCWSLRGHVLYIKTHRTLGLHSYSLTMHLYCIYQNSNFFGEQWKTDKKEIRCLWNLSQSPNTGALRKLVTIISLPWIPNGVCAINVCLVRMLLKWEQACSWSKWPNEKQQPARYETQAGAVNVFGNHGHGNKLPFWIFVAMCSVDNAERHAVFLCVSELSCVVHGCPTGCILVTTTWWNLVLLPLSKKMGS